jgi:hypothetical protein
MYITLVYLNIALVYLANDWRNKINVDFSRVFRARTWNDEANG